MDWPFIRGKESRDDSQGLTAYVPRDDKPGNDGGYARNSGVTVAHGFDVGQHSATDLRRLKLSDDVVNRLSPFTKENLPFRGQNAQAYLNVSPLYITPDQQDQIDRAVMRDNYDTVARKYNALKTTDVPFEKLPQQAQTAIMSVAHQFGPNLDNVQDPGIQSFWQSALDGNWLWSRAILEGFGGKYGPRRKSEGALLRDAIDDGALPSNAPIPKPRPDD